MGDKPAYMSSRTWPKTSGTDGWTLFFTLNRRGAPLLVFIENKSTVWKITKQGTIWDIEEPNKMGSRNKKGNEEDEL